MAKSSLRSTLFSKLSLVALCFGSSFAPSQAVASLNVDIYDYFSELEQQSFRADSRYVSESQILNGGDLISRGRDVEARSIGQQAGKYWAQQELQAMLNGQEMKLNNVFDLSPYIQSYGQYYVFPPIVTESRGAKTYKDARHQSFTIADRAFFIRSEPRFVDAIPTWKSYVRFTAQKPQISSKGLLPSNSEQKKLWRENFDLGWKEGVKSALLNFDLQFARLTHDIMGIQRYVILRDAGYITEPQFTTSSQPVSGNKNMMFIGNKYVAITVSPKLDHNYRNWRIIPELPVLEGMVPTRYLQLLNFGSGI